MTELVHGKLGVVNIGPEMFAQTMTDAVEKRHTEFRFQSVNLPGSRRLTEVQAAARPGKAAVLRNADEGPQLSKVHVPIMQ